MAGHRLIVIGYYWARSIGVGHSLRFVGRVVYSWVGTDLNWAGVLLVEIIGPLWVGQLEKVLEDVVSTRVGRLVPLFVAGVVFVRFQVADAFVGVEVIVGSPVFVVYLVAFEPLFESHGTHEIVVGHGVEWVEGIFYPLLGGESHLPGGVGSSAGFAVVVENFSVFEAPRFQNAGIWVIGFGDVVLLILPVEEENLGIGIVTLL